ncbi:translation initiation factor IF-1, chloroplastic [Rhodamnia argentea]|uniref:Translation initiation factor IF-1, chloroplastic n=1 Tax=Rhodamnia argentea TaxID=178133 RepID=A0A8B8MSE5_9MYRT|nr:translation initiation factor IF-1, chloroplastic [Rhodamnia argentea]XP_048135476.1 translation initiation factor IF-1, chloroplastic [Rhodamnia argentea]
MSFALFNTLNAPHACLRMPIGSNKLFQIPPPAFFKLLQPHDSPPPPPSLSRPIAPRPVVALCAKKASQGMKEQKWTHEGIIVESLPNGMFRVRLDNADVVLGYISGKIRKNFIRMLPGDKVKIEVSRYDSTRGRIIYRLRNKDSGD